MTSIGNHLSSFWSEKAKCEIEKSVSSSAKIVRFILEYATQTDTEKQKDTGICVNLEYEAARKLFESAGTELKGAELELTAVQSSNDAKALDIALVNVRKALSQLNIAKGIYEKAESAVKSPEKERTLSNLRLSQIKNGIGSQGVINNVFFSTIR